MTERLRQLMHDEVGHLSPRTPDAASVLTEGRRLRRRQRLSTALAAGAATAVIVTTAGFVAQGSGGSGATDPSPADAAPDAAAPVAYAVGSDVHLGDVVAQVPDTVHSLHYTSLGVLVRSNPNDGASDGSGPESLTLVRWDGSTADLGTIPEGVGPATDPAEEVYVLAESRGDGFVAVVRDAATGDTIDEVLLPDLPKSYWDVPPLALDGDTLYVGHRDETSAVDLASGEGTTVDGMSGGLPDVRAGRTVVQQRGSLVVRDVTTGEDLLVVDVKGYAWGTLSPDGRFLKVVAEGELTADDYVEPDSIQVHDVSTGEVRDFAGAYSWGWTADGDLFKPVGDTLTTCDAANGACEEAPLTPALPQNAELRLGGQVYES